MPSKKLSNPEMKPMHCQGFILLEALVAMTMILGVWMASVETYQRLALNLAQQESKRAQLGKDSDVFETQEQNRTVLNIPSKVISDEPARMPSRNRSMRTATQPTIKDKR